MEVLGIPSDEVYHVFRELPDGYLITARAVYGIEGRPGSVFIQFYFRPRPAEVLRQLFADVVRRLGELAGLGEREIFLNVVPSPTEYWWAHGCVVDPVTGFDVRIPADKVPAQGGGRRACARGARA